MKRRDGHVAQMVERVISMHKALGSSASIRRKQNKTKTRNTVDIIRETKISMRYHFHFNWVVRICLRQGLIIEPRLTWFELIETYPSASVS